MAKHTPREQFDPKKVRDLNARKANDKYEGDLDRAKGRDTRMGRDGGTSRRVRK